MRTTILFACLCLAGCSVEATEPDRASSREGEKSPFNATDIKKTFAWLCQRTDKLDETPEDRVVWANDAELEAIKKEVVGRKIRWTLKVQQAYPQHIGDDAFTRVRFLPLIKKAKGYTQKRTALWIEPDFGGQKKSPVPPFQVPFETWHREEMRPNNDVRLHAKIAAVRFGGAPKAGWAYYFQVSDVRLGKAE